MPAVLTFVVDGLRDDGSERHHVLGPLVALYEHLETEPHRVQVYRGRLQAVVEPG